MDAESIIDEEEIRKDLGDESFEALDRSLRDQWAAELWFFKQKLARVKAASDRIERCAEQSTGFRNTVQLDPFGFACLERFHPGWQQDAKSFEKDLIRWHPECEVKVGRRMNFVGWTRSLNDGIRGQRHEPARAAEIPNPKSQIPKKFQTSLVLTDKRGNAA